MFLQTVFCRFPSPFQRIFCHCFAAVYHAPQRAFPPFFPLCFPDYADASPNATPRHRRPASSPPILSIYCFCHCRSIIPPVVDIVAQVCSSQLITRRRLPPHCRQRLPRLPRFATCHAAFCSMLLAMLRFTRMSLHRSRHCLDVTAACSSPHCMLLKFKPFHLHFQRFDTASCIKIAVFDSFTV